MKTKYQAAKDHLKSSRKLMDEGSWTEARETAFNAYLLLYKEGADETVLDIACSIGILIGSTNVLIAQTQNTSLDDIYGLFKSFIKRR